MVSPWVRASPPRIVAGPRDLPPRTFHAGSAGAAALRLHAVRCGPEDMRRRPVRDDRTGPGPVRDDRPLSPDARRYTPRGADRHRDHPARPRRPRAPDAACVTITPAGAAIGVANRGAGDVGTRLQPAAMNAGGTRRCRARHPARVPSRRVPIGGGWRPMIGGGQRPIGGRTPRIKIPVAFFHNL